MLGVALEYDDDDEFTESTAADDDMFPLESIDQDLNVAVHELPSEIQEVVFKFPEVFTAVPGRNSAALHVVHTGKLNAAPIRQSAYWVPYSKREALKTELDEMLKAKIVRPSTSPWAFPILMVPKKDGSIQFCIDFRKINTIAKFDAHPMPRAEEIFESIGQARFISTLDLAKGYWQIPMEDSFKGKTAFVTPFGLYHFEVMLFGFARCATQLFNEL